MTPILLVIAMVACCLISAVIGAGIERSRSIDYKKRWQEALAALDQAFEGKTPKPVLLRTQAVNYNSRPSEQKGSIPLDQATLDKLEWWDRREMEIERAKKGLLPLDDLKRGMPSNAVSDVIKARIKYGTQK